MNKEAPSSPLECCKKTSAHSKRCSYFTAMLISSIFLALIWFSSEVFNPAFFIIWLIFNLYLLNRITSFKTFVCPKCQKKILDQNNPDTCSACGAAYYEKAEKEKDTPLCIHCMSEVSRNSYYCKNCGKDSGQLTAYVPFVNIQFMGQFYAKLWKIATGRIERSWFSRIICVVSLTTLFPFLIIFILVSFFFTQKKIQKIILTKFVGGCFSSKSQLWIWKCKSFVGRHSH